MAKGEAYGTATDVWAFGVLLFELLAAKSPFAQHHGAANVRCAPRHSTQAPVDNLFRFVGFAGAATAHDCTQVRG